MLFATKSLSSIALERDVLRSDKKSAASYDACSVGEKAIYFNFSYIPLEQIQRVFKRLAVSKGFYEKDRIYGTIPYLVVQYDDGKEKVCRFEHEDKLDALLYRFRNHTDIPVGKPKQNADA